jgi:hypothetical protein
VNVRPGLLFWQYRDEHRYWRFFFAIGALFCLSTLSLSAHNFKADLDGSILWAANVYRDYGLQVGCDIVHVFGPLGWLIYPAPIHGHLSQAWLFHTFLHLLFIGGLTVFALVTKEYSRAAFFILIFSAFSPNYLKEFHIYSILLAFYVIDLRIPRYNLWIVPAALSAIFFFVKFNLTISVTLLILTYTVFGWSQKRLSPLKALLIPGTFAGLLLLIGVFQFSSVEHFINWLDWSTRIAAGNSEAMSVPPSLFCLFFALSVLCILLWMIRVVRRKSESSLSLIWGGLVMVLYYFVFKHGLVRADDAHICHFFWFVPVLAASCLLLRPSKEIVAAVALIALIGIIAPSAEGILPSLKIPFEGAVDAVAAWRESQKSWNTAIPKGQPDAALTEEECRAVGSHTVDVLLYETALLYKTGLRWRPPPFFQSFLARTERTDAINSIYIRGARSAEYLFWTWSALDGSHPLYIAPASQLSIAECYAPLMENGDRLLLKKRTPRPFVRRTIEKKLVRWDDSVSVPDAEGVVLAKIAIEYTLAGKILKALSWVPPVYIEVDKKERYRFIPSTARKGIIVGGLPRSIEQYGYWVDTGKPHPDCPKTREMRILPRPLLPYFGNVIEIEFEVLESAQSVQGR